MRKPWMQSGFGNIPHTILVDGDTGIIIANGISGEDLDSTIAKALEKKAKK